MSKLARSRLRTSSPSLHEHSPQVHLKTGSSTDSKFTRSWRSKCISILARPQPPSVAPHSPENGRQAPTILAFQMPLETRSIMALQSSSELAQSQPPGVSPNSLDYGLQVYLQTRSIMTSKSIFKLTQSWHPSVSPNSLDYDLQVHSTMASKNKFKLSPSQPRNVCCSSYNHHFQMHLELLWSTACSQSRYSVCRWVAI